LDFNDAFNDRPFNAVKLDLFVSAMTNFVGKFFDQKSILLKKKFFSSTIDIINSNTQ